MDRVVNKGYPYYLDKFHIVDLNDLCDPQSLNHMIVYVYSCHHLPVVNIAVKNAAAT